MNGLKPTQMWDDRGGARGEAQNCERLTIRRRSLGLGTTTLNSDLA